MNQSEVPYFEALKLYLEENLLEFNVPGHNQQKNLSPDFSDLLQRFGTSADITEVLGVDDIHHPREQCLKAQSLAAQAFGSRSCFFLVNGSTLGNQAMFLASLGPQDTILIPRASHRSVQSALLLSGARAHCFSSSFDPQTLVSLPPSLEDVARALDDCPQAEALFLTSPDYYGQCPPLVDILGLAKDRGILVLVDEAWGVHLPFLSQLPTSAIAAGADMVCQSAHKMGGALTPGAYLHLCGQRVDSARVQAVLNHLQTSSPSSLVVASLDCARRRLALEGETLWSQTLDQARVLREEIAKIPDLWVSPAGMDRDPTRLTIQALERGYSGYELARWLRATMGIQVELWEPHQVLVLLQPGHTEGDCKALVSALQSLPRKKLSFPLKALRESALDLHSLSISSTERLDIRREFYRPNRRVNLRSALDQVSAEHLYCYPPGIPLVCPGETLRAQHLDHIENLVNSGGSVVGASDSSLKTILIAEPFHD